MFHGFNWYKPFYNNTCLQWLHLPYINIIGLNKHMGNKVYGQHLVEHSLKANNNILVSHSTIWRTSWDQNKYWLLVAAILSRCSNLQVKNHWDNIDWKERVRFLAELAKHFFFARCFVYLFILCMQIYGTELPENIHPINKMMEWKKLESSMQANKSII